MTLEQGGFLKSSHSSETIMSVLIYRNPKCV